MVIGSISSFLTSLPDRVPFYIDHRLFTGLMESPEETATYRTGSGLFTSLLGEVDIRVNHQVYTITPDSFLVLNSGSQVQFSIKSPLCRPLMLFFGDQVAQIVSVELFAKANGNDMPLSLRQLKDYELIEHIYYSHASLTQQLKLLVSLGQSCASFHALKADAIIRTLLKDLSDQNYEAMAVSSRLPVIKQSTRTNLYKKLSVTKEWMEHHFLENIDLEACANMAVMNKEHFIRHFKTAFGSTPHQYLTALRMKWAKQQLAKTKAPIQEISERIGFDTPSSFSFQFRKVTGMSPREFRKTAGPEEKTGK